MPGLMRLFWSSPELPIFWKFPVMVARMSPHLMFFTMVRGIRALKVVDLVH